MDWVDTQALGRVFCNRAYTDPPPNITADPCLCSTDLATLHHLLRDCQLLDTQWGILQRTTIGDIQTSQFIILPKNTHPLCQFLHTTCLGYSTHLRFVMDQPTPQGSEASGSDSPEPDFGTFEI